MAHARIRDARVLLAEADAIILQALRNNTFGWSSVMSKRSIITRRAISGATRLLGALWTQ